MDHSHDLEIGGTRIGLGEVRDIDLPVTEGYSGAPLTLPMRVIRAEEPGPTVFVTGAIHGDEVNGTGIVREVMLNRGFVLSAGSLVLVPVVNLLGFERHSRYLPDRRDLNRAFPGSADGSQTARFAHRVFSEIVRNCDWGIDLHTAAVRRTNYPNVRGDLTDEKVARLAFAFGCELAVHGKGPEGSLRREACEAGCPTIILEAGEVWKIEPGVVEIGARGVRNTLIELGMVRGTPDKPPYQARVDRTVWVRAGSGGMLRFHVAPGDIVEKGQAMATNTTFLGREISVLESPDDGVILGMTTLPAVVPGMPVCHLAIPTEGTAPLRAARHGADDAGADERMRDDLATSLHVDEPEA